jgi:hypothetical protein
VPAAQCLPCQSQGCNLRWLKGVNQVRRGRLREYEGMEAPGVEPRGVSSVMKPISLRSGSQEQMGAKIKGGARILRVFDLQPSFAERHDGDYTPSLPVLRIHFTSPASQNHSRTRLQRLRFSNQMIHELCLSCISNPSSHTFDND